MSENLQSLWKDQPVASDGALPLEVLRSRSRDISWRTRSETLASGGAVSFFLVLMAWRFESIRDPIVLLSFLPMVVWLAVIGWRIRRGSTDIAASGVEFYKAELERRRVHLASFWVWHGPLVLGCLTLGAIWFRKSVVSLERLVSVAPLLVVLVVWTVTGIRKRKREREAIEMEIEEV